MPVGMTLTPYTEGYATENKIHGSIKTITTLSDGTYGTAEADWSVQYGDSYIAKAFPPTNEVEGILIGLQELKQPLSIVSIEFVVNSGSLNETLTFTTKGDLPSLPHSYVSGEPLTLILTKSSQHFKIALTVVGEVTC